MQFCGYCEESELIIISRASKFQRLLLHLKYDFVNNINITFTFAVSLSAPLYVRSYTYSQTESRERRK